MEHRLSQTLQFEVDLIGAAAAPGTSARVPARSPSGQAHYGRPAAGTHLHHASAWIGAGPPPAPTSITLRVDRRRTARTPAVRSPHDLISERKRAHARLTAAGQDDEYRPDSLARPGERVQPGAPGARAPRSIRSSSRSGSSSRVAGASQHVVAEVLDREAQVPWRRHGRDRVRVCLPPHAALQEPPLEELPA